MSLSSFLLSLHFLYHNVCIYFCESVPHCVQGPHPFILVQAIFSILHLAVVRWPPGQSPYPLVHTTMAYSPTLYITHISYYIVHYIHYLLHCTYYFADGCILCLICLLPCRYVVFNASPPYSQYIAQNPKFRTYACAFLLNVT